METTNKRRVSIAVDGHVLFQKQKTGVGRTAEAMIKELCKDSSVDVSINIVDLLGYRSRKIIKEYRGYGCKIKLCWWMPYSFYRNIFDRFKIPYCILFNKRSNVTIFFEYYVPYGVGTQVYNYVYDVNYKVFPKTVEAKNLKWLVANMEISCMRSDMILTISDFSKDEISKYLNINKEKIRVVPCGIDVEQFLSVVDDLKIDSTKRKYAIQGDYILYLGTLEPRKNLSVLIKAYGLLLDTLMERDSSYRRQCPQLVIAGKKGWMYDELFDLINDLKLGEWVIFTDYVNNETARILLNGAMLFVFPSMYEGFGIPPLEAMACGTPVIVSDAASLPEVVEEAALVFRSNDYMDLCDKMKQILYDDSCRELYSLRGRNRAKHFSWRNSEHILVDIIRESLIKER